LQQFNTPPNRWWFQTYVQIFHRSQFVILYFRLPLRYSFVEIGWPFSPTNPPPSWPTMATIHGALKALASLKFLLITRVVGVTDDNTFLPRLRCVPLCCFKVGMVTQMVILVIFNKTPLKEGTKTTTLQFQITSFGKQISFVDVHTSTYFALILGIFSMPC